LIDGKKNKKLKKELTTVVSYGIEYTMKKCFSVHTSSSMVGGVVVGGV